MRQRLTVRQQEVARLQADLERQRTSIDAQRRREQNISSRVVRADQQARLTARYVARLSKEMTALDGDIGRTDANIIRVDSSLTARTANLGDRVRFLYMGARRRQRSVIWSAKSLAEWVAHRRYLDAVNRQDSFDIRQIHSEREELARTRQSNIDQRQYRETLLSDYREQHATLTAQFSERRKLLERVRQSRSLGEQTAKTLAQEQESGQRQLALYISQIAENAAGRGRSSVRSFADLQGRLPWPAQGDVLIGFGRRRDLGTKTVTRKRGVDIGTPNGSAVKVVAAGEVIKVDWFRGYGLFAMVNHGGGFFTVYAHLEEAFVRVGDVVDQEQVIARSGDAVGVAKLHFELWRGAEALDPQAWLANRGSHIESSSRF
ncbi:MAG: peptidoglycan DD-metalloendopeptidase family protein [Candidatus Latescibacteria bacterium]|jgi:septal ring factor EnvC (AmiA/AmiB activator)|nr:peptidoglycan DD-metalloendopeptidase family protein [Candidatus Latescibacterota bacterium]